MELVHQVLKGITDESIIQSYVVMPMPLRELIRNYNKVALTDPDLPEITEVMTGAQLKDAISMMQAEDQVSLLHAFLLASKRSDASSVLYADPEKEQEKRLRHISLSVLGIGAGGAFFAVIGATVALAIWGPSRAGGETVSVLSPLTDIANIIRYILVPKQQ